MRYAIYFVLLGCGSLAPVAMDDAGSSMRPDRPFIPTDGGSWPPGDPGCGLEAAAFCDTFDSIATARGRAGDLERARWSGARNNPQLPTGNGATIAAGPATVTGCRDDLPGRVLPDQDALVCAPNAAIASSHLLVAVGAQNYGQNSYRIRQPFDFRGRTGRIVLDAEANIVNRLLGWISISITGEPSPTPSYSIGAPGTDNDEGGAVPRNAIEIHFSDDCAGRAERGHVSVGLIDVLTDFVDAEVHPDNPHCITGSVGHLNHIEIALSRTRIEVYGTDYSEDGVHFGELSLITAADIDIPFERGYVHLSTHNHATLKYTEDGQYGYTSPLDAWITRWDNVGFDGPVVGGWRESEVPDSLVESEQAWSLHGGVMNIGYRVADEAHEPNEVLHLSGVDPSGATRATLALNAWYNLVGATPSTWVLRYRVNGHDWHEHPFDAAELAVATNTHSHGAMTHELDVPVSELVAGENTLEFTTRNVDQSYPPAVHNIDLVLETR